MMDIVSVLAVETSRPTPTWMRWWESRLRCRRILPSLTLKQGFELVQRAIRQAKFPVLESIKTLQPTLLISLRTTICWREIRSTPMLQALRQVDLRLTLRSLAWASVKTLPIACTRFADLVTLHSKFVPLPSKMPRYQRAKSSITPIAITIERIADSRPLVCRFMGIRGSQDSARSRRSLTRAWKAPNSSSPNRLKIR